MLQDLTSRFDNLPLLSAANILYPMYWAARHEVAEFHASCKVLSEYFSKSATLMGADLGAPIDGMLLEGQRLTFNIAITDWVERNPPPARFAAPSPMQAYEQHIAQEDEDAELADVLAGPEEVGYTTRCYREAFGSPGMQASVSEWL